MLFHSAKIPLKVFSILFKVFSAYCGCVWQFHSLNRHCKKSSYFTLALLPGAFFFVAVAFVFFLLSSASESDESIFDLVWLLEAEAEEALLDVAPALEELVLSELLVFFGGEAFVISRVFLTGVALKKNET